MRPLCESFLVYHHSFWRNQSFQTAEYFGFEDLNSVADFVERMWREQTGGGKSVKMADEPVVTTLKPAQQDSMDAQSGTTTTVNDTSYESDSQDSVSNEDVSNENNTNQEENESDSEKDEKDDKVC